MNLSSPELLLKSNPKHESAPIIEAGVRAAERKVQGQVSFVVDTTDGLGDKMADQLAAKVRGDPESKSYVAIAMDAKTLCECGSQAKYRLPPTRQPQMSRILTGFLATRDDGLADGDCLVCIDGGKGNDWMEKINKILKQKGLVTTKHVVIYTHESVQARMERASKAPLDLTEHVNFVTPDSLALKARVWE